MTVLVDAGFGSFWSSVELAGLPFGWKGRTMVAPEGFWHPGAAPQRIVSMPGDVAAHSAHTIDRTTASGNRICLPCLRNHRMGKAASARNRRIPAQRAGILLLKKYFKSPSR
jgi:hypothetical protein